MSPFFFILARRIDSDDCEKDDEEVECWLLRLHNM